MPRNLQGVGVSKAVKDSDIRDLDDAAQDRFIAEVAKAMTEDLKRMVGGARPRSEFLFQVTGPHDDPLLGLHHVHTLAAKFDLDELTGTEAYRLLVGTPDTAPDQHMGIQLDQVRPQ